MTFIHIEIIAWPGPMKKPHDDISSQQQRNRLAVFTFTAFAAGVIFAVYMGAAPMPRLTDSHQWVAVIVSSFSATISAYAVYLVNQTLLAAREMVADQKKFGDYQTRAWVLVEKDEVRHFGYDGQDDLHSVRVVLKNFGNTPAIAMSLCCIVKQLPYPIPATPIDRFVPSKQRGELAQGQQISSSIGELPLAGGMNLKTAVEVHWQYRTTDGASEEHFQRWLAEVDDGGYYFRPELDTDSANFGRQEHEPVQCDDPQPICQQ